MDVTQFVLLYLLGFLVTLQLWFMTVARPADCFAHSSPSFALMSLLAYLAAWPAILVGMGIYGLSRVDWLKERQWRLYWLKERQWRKTKNR